jgi:5-formyltetrahydrofolate cyclo-ligase
MPTKEKLRGEMKARLKALPQKEFDIQGREAVSVLSSSSVWKKYRTVYIFLSMNREIETFQLLETSLRDGKKVFAPKLKEDDLVFCRVLSANGPWREGPFGIREPLSDETAKSDDFPVLIITPGIAFDRSGNRLGRGRGYYDRFFAELDSASRQYFAVGLCMDFQLVNQVPVEENDKHVDGILTKAELLLINRQS